MFRKEALPLIDEERFAAMYSADMGRPNRAVQTGVLVLKCDLTDIEANTRAHLTSSRRAVLRLLNATSLGGCCCPPRSVAVLRGATSRC